MEIFDKNGVLLRVGDVVQFKPRHYKDDVLGSVEVVNYIGLIYVYQIGYPLMHILLPEQVVKVSDNALDDS